MPGATTAAGTVITCRTGSTRLVGTDNRMKTKTKLGLGLESRSACFFVNNEIYEITGGQNVLTTHLGMWPATTPFGRDIEATGQPTRIYEILKEIDNATYVRRVRVSE
jgi:hypothetical protein